MELLLIKQTSWRVEKADWKADNCATQQARLESDDVAAVEFQTAGTRVLSADQIVGKQFAELDSHCHGSNGNDTRVSIYQHFVTVPGQVYKLSFRAASRDNNGALRLNITNAENKSTAADPIPFNYHFSSSSNLESMKLLNREMKSFIFYFQATSERTRVSFTDQVMIEKHMAHYLMTCQ